MKKANFTKKLLIAAISLLLSFPASAQLPDGTIVGDFTLTDLEGDVHNLYTYLGQGKKVIIDVSAIWCAPCWSYHTAGHLETIWDSYGPAGTNEFMVLWIEGDEGTLAEMQGGGSSQGNWITGVGFPQFLTIAPNGTSVVSLLDIGYFPTVYTVCPDHTIYESGQKTASAHYTFANTTCAPLSTNTNDVKAFSSTSPSGTYCNNYVTPNLKIQNYGTANLTSCTIIVNLDGTPVQTINWTGNLAMYAGADVVINQINSIADGSHVVSFELSNPNGSTDQDPSNNIVSKSFSINSAGAIVQMDLLTDNYPTETSWNLKPQGSSTILASGEGYSSTQHHYIENWCLTPGSCYTYTIFDEYGDGMSYNGVTGSINISYNSTVLATIAGNSFTTSKSVNFCVPTSTGINYTLEKTVGIFPNPSNGFVSFSNADGCNVQIMNMLGEVVAQDLCTSSFHTLNLNDLANGAYIVRISKDNELITRKLVLDK